VSRYGRLATFSIYGPVYSKQKAPFNRMKCISKFLVAFFLGQLGVQAATADIQILQWERPGRVERDGSGDYDHLIAAVLAEINMPVLAKIEPLRRIRQALLSTNSVCVAPGSLTLFLTQNPTIQSEKFRASVPIDRVTGHIFSRLGDAPVHSPDELSGKRMAVWWGVPLNSDIAASGVELIYAANEKEAIQMLLAGRVDTVWGTRPGSSNNFEHLAGAPAIYDRNFIMMTLDLQVMCRNTAETRLFLQKVDLVLEAMRHDGRLKKLLGPDARVIGIDVPRATAQ